jgi:hypothetical protein
MREERRRRELPRHQMTSTDSYVKSAISNPKFGAFGRRAIELVSPLG